MPHPAAERGKTRGDLYRRLLGLRAAEIVPRLLGSRSAGASAVGPAAVVARWRLGDGALLTLACNLGEREASLAEHAFGQLLFESAAMSPNTPVPERWRPTPPSLFWTANREGGRRDTGSRSRRRDCCRMGRCGEEAATGPRHKSGSCPRRTRLSMRDRFATRRKPRADRGAQRSVSLTHRLSRRMRATRYRSSPKEDASIGLLELENGETRDVRPERVGDGLSLPGITEPGYHKLHLRDRVVTLAVAPRRCITAAELVGRSRSWGVAVQLYGLRERGDFGIGNASGLIAFVDAAARAGADAVALSPNHAMFSADPARYGPYSPSSRLFLNPLHADPAIVFGQERVRATAQKLGLDEQAKVLEDATAHRLGGARPRRSSPCSAASSMTCGMISTRAILETPSRAFAQEAARCSRSMRVSKPSTHGSFNKIAIAGIGEAGRSRGKTPTARRCENFRRRIAARSPFTSSCSGWPTPRWPPRKRNHARREWGSGLIADLAVGMDAGGSHAWSQQTDILVGLNVGAPPDLFNPQGQNWGLTTFSPWTLRTTHFAPFLATLRAAMRHAGGVRIDHAMGLTRLWLVPEGASPADGAYLTYPCTDLLRLIRLESHRHRAIVIAEDLGTVPEGFQDELADSGIDGMRVLWFERDDDGAFRPPVHVVGRGGRHDEHP